MRILAVCLFASACGGYVLVVPVARTSVNEPPAKHSVPSATQKTYASPQEAVEALLVAFKTEDEAALLDIFGHDHEKLIRVSDKVAQSEAFQQLYEAAQESRELHEQGTDRSILVIGRKAWPFPIPLVKNHERWRFDTAAGEEEIFHRRMGANELATIDVCQTYVTAQVEYAGEDRDGDEVLEYAQHIASMPGQRDGLYWRVDPENGEPLSPFGPLAAEASAYAAAGKKVGQAIPFNGYFFRILTRQGEHVPGGKYDYVINGNLIAGFALVAWPADYGSSGIMTFMVSHHGKLMEKDLGERTGEVMRNVDAYDPDPTWARVEAN